MSIQAVAKKAGVSVATVSRAFNLPEQVAPATRQIVERAARSLDYLPNASARTLRTQRSHVIGVVLPTLLNPTFAECLQGIAQAALALGYAIIPTTTGYELDAEERAVQLLLAGNVNGLILVVSNPSTSLTLPRLRNRQFPYVLAYNRHPDHPCVSVDSEAAVTDLVHRLVLLGHRRIAMVSGTLAASDRAQQRYRGYLTGMERARLTSLPLIEVPFVDSAVDALCSALKSRDRPTAVLCSNDVLAIRCTRAAHLSGLAVPRDISVIGFDGIALGADLTPALTTIEQPSSEIGRHCVELLIKAMDAGVALQADASLLLPHTFRAGESCASPL